jgi:hypothetical protein
MPASNRPRFAAHIRFEIEKWTKAARPANVKPD